MFPRLRQQLLARADLLVELSTLGEYGLDERGRVMALDGDEQVATRDREPFGACAGEAAVVRRLPRTRDLCAGVDDSRGCGATAGRGAAARP
jgi:hypothetical protein